MSQVINLLLVEDNPADVELTRVNLEQAKIHIELHVVMDGAEALDYLFQRNAHVDAKRPDLVLLDLNLPKVNGNEVLAKVKADSDLKRISIVVLTSSEAETDIAASYENYANAYVTKPIGLDSFNTIVKSIEDFWLTVVRLPPKKD